MKSIKVKLFKALKITGIAFLSLLLLLFILPYFFPKTIAEGVKTWTNNNINGKINFSKLSLSFYNHFPSLTLTLHDFSLKGSNPYPNDTLIAAEEVAFGINLKSVFFDKKVLINQVYLDDAALKVQVDTNGIANYNILKTEKEKKQTSSNDSGSANLRINKIQISNCHLVYNDRSIPMLINAKGFNYIGTGDLSNAIFDLDSKLNIDALDFTFDHEDYLREKKIDAQLLTQINTNSLVLLFRRNDLNINKLKLDFKGELKFLSNGYMLDFKAAADDIKLYSLVTALPPKYLKWLEKTEVKGNADLLFSLKGNYIASTNKKPDVRFDMKIRNGYVAYNNAAPASNLQFRLRTLLPSLNTDSLHIDLDTFAFNMNKDFFDAKVHTLGLQQPTINAAVKMNMDLDKLQSAIGFNAADFKGRFVLDVLVGGQFKTTSSAKGDVLIQQIPNYTAKASLLNGYFKMGTLPQGIQNIDFNIAANCSDGNYLHSSLRIDNIKATALNNFVQGKIWLDNLIDFPMDANFHSKVNLSEIKNFIPLDSLHLAGILNLDITAKGKYAPERKLFPTIKLGIDLKNGSVQTKYYPHPISNIQTSVDISDPTGTAKDLEVAITPLSFDFEAKPFLLSVFLKNFADVHYDVTAKGELDLEKIYAVFAQKDLNVSGFAKVDLKLKGTQSDASSGRYGKLMNSGTMQLHNIRVAHSAYLPLPFLLREGLFSFRNDKFYFDKFKANYGQSDISLDGYLTNVINYALGTNDKLNGSFNFKSNYLLVDEFMPQNSSATIAQDSLLVDTSGVIVVPPNLNITFTASAKRISYNGLQLDNFSGQMLIDSAKIKLIKTGFGMIGTTVNMDAVYQNMNNKTAHFDFAIQAENFDVHRAYKEVKLFHDMAPAASSAQGIIGVDYRLKGRLDSAMSPVYPSLNGGGTLSVRNIKFKGFKLLNNASKESGKEVLKDPDVKDIKLNTTVKNNIIALEKVKIKMAGFRLRIEGQSDFDHRLKFKMRLGLPPLGIIGIPMTVSGTSDNPKIKVGKQDTEDIPEQEDDFVPDNTPPVGTDILPNW